MTVTLSLSARRALNMGKQSRAGALGLLAYDHFITLGNEIELVWWQDKKSPGFWLYIFNRFLALLWLIFDTIPLTPSGVVPPKVCVIYLMCDDIVTLLTTITVQIILQLRVYALYERSRTILFVLVGLCVAELATMAILVGFTISRISHLPVISTPTGCAYTGLIPISSLFWIPGLIYEPILCGLAIYKAFYSSAIGNPGKSITSPIVLMLARDSLIYFVLIFAELLVSTIIWARYPKYLNVIMPWSAALPSLLGSRLLLNMRQRVYNNEAYTPGNTDDGLHQLSTWAAAAATSNDTSDIVDASPQSLPSHGVLQKRD